MSSFAVSTSGSGKHHSGNHLPGTGQTLWSDHGSCIHTTEASQYHHAGHQLPADPEWEAKEEMRLRELEEARARAAQMEKTMRWWSDCTANWREKWSKVRTERNKVREELRVLQTKLDFTAKDNSGLRRDKQELEVELEKARVVIGLNVKPGSMISHSPACSIHALAEHADNEAEQAISVVGGDVQSLLLTSPREQFSHSSSNTDLIDHVFKTSSNRDDGILSPAVSKHSAELDAHGGKKTNYWGNIQASADIENADHHFSMLQKRLDEANKNLQLEIDEKMLLNKSLARLQQDHTDLKSKHEELKMSKQDVLKELSQTKAEHQDEMDSFHQDLEDEISCRSSMEQRLADLRAQMERLQAENAVEWGKRERLETEKLALERENKKLVIHIADVEERLEQKIKNGGGNMSNRDIDVKALQHELHDKNKELSDLKHSHSKLKKSLQDKTTELGHTFRRAEQYETEVKRLRSRVEELKKELATAEDEIDGATNGMRKLQRTNDELQEQIDSLQVQVEHLQTRLRSNSHSLLVLRGSNSLLNNGISDDDTA